MPPPDGVSCPTCDFANPAGMRFCGRCGGDLKNVCPECSFENPAGFSFCGRCGSPLHSDEVASAAPKAAATGAEPSERVEAERRQLTVMFCDLVGSTALSQRLDPEDLRIVLRSYQAAAVDLVERADGYVAQYLGDGLLVYFGYPTAREDDPRRAVRCALAVIEAVRKLDLPFEEKLQTRIGIHTGPVVAGEIGAGARTDRLALGTTPNLAARLQGAAEPDQVAISRATHDLVEGYFQIEPLGRRDLSGFAEPVEVFRALAETGIHNRFELAQSRGLAPLVGRREELEALERLVASAATVEGQVVMVSGEAGVGKSRLLAALRERCSGAIGRWITARCSPQLRSTALAPFTAVLEGALEIESPCDSAELRRRLEGALSERSVEIDQVFSVVASLLSVPLDPGSSPAVTTSRRQRQATLDLLLSLITPSGCELPVVLEVEDLHWADPSTLELLDLLIDETPKLPLLLLLSFRPEHTPRWLTGPYTSSIVLQPLAANDCAELVRSILEDGRGGLVDTIVARTDGVPLFVEELTRAVVATQELGGFDPDQIPLTLRDSLTARLDALGPAKGTAQLAAVLGRRFDYPLLSTVSDLSEERLIGELDALLDSGLAYQRGRIPNATFTFKHALVQEAAYDSLLRKQRRELHARVAQQLAGDTSPESVPAETAALLAHHYESADLVIAAIPYRLRAGRAALERLAFNEATVHLERGLELLPLAPDANRGDLDTDGTELELLLALASAQIVLEGYASPKVEQTYSQARQLCARHDDPPLTILRGLHSYDIVRGDREASAATQERLLRRIEHTESPFELAACCGTTGSRAILAGEFAQAHDLLTRSIAAYDPGMHREMLSVYGDDPGLVSYAYLPLSLWCVGQLDRVDAAADDLLAVTAPLGPWARALGFAYAQSMARIRRRIDRTLELAGRAMEICEQEGLPYWHSVARIGYGWALAKKGHAEGLEELRAAMIAWEATGAGVPRAGHLSIQADVLGDLGRHEEALALVDEAIDWSESTLESNSDSALRSTKARLLLQLGRDPDEALPWFEEAVEVARAQGSITLELLSSAALAHFLMRQGERERPVELLRRACGNFPDDLDEPELGWARGLLGRLTDDEASRR